MLSILVDADGCPVKDEACRVAQRYQLAVTFVANKRLRAPVMVPPARVVVVGDAFDAADDWIAETAEAGDIVVTADLLLGQRCLGKGARVVDPRGRILTEDSIGEILASREIGIQLRAMGVATGGPAPFERRDRSQFLQALDRVVQSIRREQGT